MRGRELAAAILVAVAAGPTVVAVFKCLEAVSSSYAPLWSTSDVAAFALSPLLGLVGGMPAAIAGSIAASLLMRRGIDSIWISGLAGSLIGAVLSMPFYVFAADDAAALTIVFEMASILMSLAYWALAIRPRRRRRLSLLHGEDAILAME